VGLRCGRKYRTGCIRESRVTSKPIGSGGEKMALRDLAAWHLGCPASACPTQSTHLMGSVLSCISGGCHLSFKDGSSQTHHDSGHLPSTFVHPPNSGDVCITFLYDLADNKTSTIHVL
jgi:hypothetical protein